MKTVHLSQIYPCDEITLGTELGYICELGKYLFASNYQLSLTNIPLGQELTKSTYWNYFILALKNGWVLSEMSECIDLSEVDELDFRNLANKLFQYVGSKDALSDFKKEVFNLSKLSSSSDTYIIEPLRLVKEPLYLDKNSPEEWVLDTSKIPNWYSTQFLFSIKNTQASQAFMSVIAYVQVQRFLTGFPKKFTIKIDESFSRLQLSLVDIVLLYEETDSLNGWCDLEFESNIDLQASYEAWWYKNFQLGYCRREYTVEEKLDLLSKLDIKVGSVVFLYTRDKCQVENFIKSIVECNLCVIRSIHKTKGIELELLYNVDTKVGEQTVFKGYTTAVRGMFDPDNIGKVRHSTKKFDLYCIGVEGLLYGEEFFISTPDKEDYLPITVQDYDTDSVCKILLNTSQACYWLLKEYGISFDESSFKKSYLSTEKCAYDLYQDKLLNTNSMLYSD